MLGKSVQRLLVYHAIANNCGLYSRLLRGKAVARHKGRGACHPVQVANYPLPSPASCVKSVLMTKSSFPFRCITIVNPWMPRSSSGRDS